MISARKLLLDEIEAFLKAHDMRPTTFGRLAANDTALVSRIRGGSNVRLDTADSLRLFMRCYRPAPTKRRAPNVGAAA
jgi:hypothetical protein